MKAIGFKKSLPLDNKECFIEFDTAKPVPRGFDILVKVEAISFNPVDYKIRQKSAVNTILDEPKIIGWDAFGTVVETGKLVTLFKPGDKVFYAGDLTRPGSHQEYQLVDARIVGPTPQSTSPAQAAAMPLTALTAWELMLERMRISPQDNDGKSILIIGGAGGVGSIAIQLAKKVLGLKVIATASRPESRDWCKRMGADVVVNHHDLVNEVRKAGIEGVDYILDLVDLNAYWEAMVEIVRPQGAIGTISDPKEGVNIIDLKRKSVSLHWELMFTRSLYETDDISQQHHILSTIASMLDDGLIRSTLNQTLQGFNVENIRKATEIIESGKAIGKLVLVF